MHISFTIPFRLLRKPFNSTTANAHSVALSHSQLKCGCQRTRKNKRRSAKKKDRQDSSSTLSLEILSLLNNNGNQEALITEASNNSVDNMEVKVASNTNKDKIDQVVKLKEEEAVSHTEVDAVDTRTDKGDNNKDPLHSHRPHLNNN